MVISHLTTRVSHISRCHAHMSQSAVEAAHLAMGSFFIYCLILYQTLILRTFGVVTHATDSEKSAARDMLMAGAGGTSTLGGLPTPALRFQLFAALVASSETIVVCETRRARAAASAKVSACLRSRFLLNLDCKYKGNKQLHTK